MFTLNLLWNYSFGVTLLSRLTNITSREQSGNFKIKRSATFMQISNHISNQVFLLKGQPI